MNRLQAIWLALLLMAPGVTACGDDGAAADGETGQACVEYLDALAACYAEAGVELPGTMDIDTYCDAYPVDFQGNTEFLLCLRDGYANGDCSDPAALPAPDCS